MNQKAITAVVLVVILVAAGLTGIYLVSLRNLKSPSSEKTGTSTVTNTVTTTNTVTATNTVTTVPPVQQSIQISETSLIFDPGPTLHVVVKNTYNSSLTTVGVQIGGSLFAPVSYELSPGQTNDFYLPLTGFTLAGQQTYSINMTFSLADGRFTTLTTTCTTPTFVYGAEITAASFVSGTVQITVGNTGNVPVTAITWAIEVNPPITGSFAPFSPIFAGMTQSGSFASFSGAASGQIYVLNLTATYSDGSTYSQTALLVGGASVNAMKATESLQVTSASEFSLQVENTGSGTSILTAVTFANLVCSFQTVNGQTIPNGGDWAIVGPGQTVIAGFTLPQGTNIPAGVYAATLLTGAGNRYSLSINITQPVIPPVEITITHAYATGSAQSGWTVSIGGWDTGLSESINITAIQVDGTTLGSLSPPVAWNGCSGTSCIPVTVNSLIVPPRTDFTITFVLTISGGYTSGQGITLVVVTDVGSYSMNVGLP